jgi:DNA adenine methylase
MEKSDKIIVPPIKTQGKKTKLVPWIKENLPEYDFWIEPFMGSGSVGFNCIEGKEAILNDINKYIVGFYDCYLSYAVHNEQLGVFMENLREEMEVLDHNFRLAGTSNSYYMEIRKELNDRLDELVDAWPDEIGNRPDFGTVGRELMLISRCCFNGLMRFNSKGRFNVPWCKKPERFAQAYRTKIINQCVDVANVLKNSKTGFESMDFKNFLELFDPYLGKTQAPYDTAHEKSHIIYLDPPYFGLDTGYFVKWQDEFEKFLHDWMKNTKMRFMLSTWKNLGNGTRNPSFDFYEANFRCVFKNHTYIVGPKETNRPEAVEALVMNY